MKNKDKKLDIKCITKAGSSLQCMIFEHMKNIYDVNSIRFKRIKPPSHGEWLQDVMAADIVILRNPVNRMISTYYSLGWTHQTDNFKKDNIEQREEIKSTTLGEWITSAGRLRNVGNVYNSILEVKQDSIMRYEDIMDNGKGYLHLILKKIGRLDLLDILWDRYSSSFDFTNKDQSDSIYNGESMAHRRNLDHKEYLHKLNNKQLEIIYNEMGDIIHRYNGLRNRIPIK